MEKTVLEFQQKHSGALPLIVQHLLKIGVRRASEITDEEIQAVKKRCEHEEAAAEKKGTVLLLTPEFQEYIITATRELAKLFNTPGLVFDVSVLIAQNIVSTEGYLREAKFDDIQREYWRNIITQYVESLGDDDFREEIEKKLEDDGMDEVIDNLVNDDHMWQNIDDDIEWYVTHLK